MKYSKDIIVEVDEDGFVSAVYCPDETYVVHVLDRIDQKKANTLEIQNYYKALEDEIEDLHNCF